MSKSKATTLSDLAMRKEKPTETNTSQESPTVSTKVKEPKDKDQTMVTASGGGTGKTAHLGLVIDPVPGGLYKVRNRGGGTPPAEFAGMWTTRSDIKRRVDAYNTSRGKEG